MMKKRDEMGKKGVYPKGRPESKKYGCCCVVNILP